MNRRDFMMLTVAVSLAAPLGALPAQAGAPVDYRPGLVTSELAAGKTVILDFHATWCTTCAAQKRAIDKLRAENPAYDKALTVIVVDWDRYKSSTLAKDLKVTQRATLVALKGKAEIGRLNWETRP
ncbi:thioredoxin family protein, partial [Thioclava sp. BHET1]